VTNIKKYSKTLNLSDLSKLFDHLSSVVSGKCDISPNRQKAKIIQAKPAFKEVPPISLINDIDDQ